MQYDVKRLRLKRKMTMAQLAEKSGVCRTTIWNIENGKKQTVKVETLSKLASALKVPVSDLFCD